MVDNTNDNTPNDDDADVFDDTFDFDDEDADALLTPEQEEAASFEAERSFEAEQSYGAQNESTEEAFPPLDEDIFAEETVAEEAPQQRTPYQSTPNRKPMIYGIIGLLVIGFLIWQGIGFFTGTKEQTPPKPVAVAPKKPAPPKAELPVVTQMEPSPEVLEKLETLQSEVKNQTQQYQDQIKQIQTDLVTTNQNAETINKNMLTLQQQLSALTGVVQNLSNQVQAVREEARKRPAPPPPPKKLAPKKEAVSKEIFASPNLTVYAIIPGRAWLREPTGKTLTVTEGDKLGEFGKVLKIDAINGVVVTSSGVILR